MTRHRVVCLVLALGPLGCGSVASRSDGGTGGSAGPATDASHDSSAGTGGAIAGTGGNTGSTDAGVGGSPAGTGGAIAGTGGSTGSTDASVEGGDGSAAGTGGVAGGTGGSAATCTGSGICGRGPTGIYCAQSNGANGFATWTQWSDNYSDAANWKSMQAYWATIQFPDVNGDGKADVCGRGTGGILCGLATDTGAFTEPTNWSTTYSDSGGWAAHPYYWATIQFPDVNGDGKADVCGRASDGVDCAVSTGVNGFGPVTSWAAAFSDASAWNSTQSYWGTIQFPDLNGDGKADVCGRGTAGVYCALSNGTNGFGTATVWQSAYSDAAGFAGSPSYWGTIQFPDINGDGKADLCARASGGIYCAISNGTNGFGPATYWSTDFTDAGGWNSTQAYWGTIQFPDVNGDGKADVCGRGVGGVICGLSNGTSGFGTTANWSAQFSDAAGYTADATLWGTIQFPDLDGDGKADVCGRSAAGMLCGKSNGTTFSVTNWLAQYTDVNGWKTDLSYGASLQTPNLNVTGCTAVTKKSVYTQPLERRLAPF